MPKFQVYHAVNPSFIPQMMKFPAEYEKVAEVECEDLEDVFRVTNHINHNWTLNPQVTMYKAGGVRSTSVGDVVVDEHGKVFLCDMAGWKEIINEN